MMRQVPGWSLPYSLTSFPSAMLTLLDQVILSSWVDRSARMGAREGKSSLTYLENKENVKS